MIPHLKKCLFLLLSGLLFLQGAVVFGKASTCEAAASPYAKIVTPKTKTYIYIRKSKSTSSKKLGKFSHGCGGTILSTSGSWLKIKSGSITGYVKKTSVLSGSALEKYAKENDFPKKATINVRSLNVREKASKTSDVVTGVKKGKTYTVLSETKLWAKIKANGSTGYVLKEYTTLSYKLKNASKVTSATTSSPKLLDMLEQGAGKELHINSKNNILSGVSRFGKAVLVAGAYEKRFKVVVPACSGAGGAAMYRCKTEGNVYDLAPLGFVNEEGGTTHVTTQNEHLGSLQSKDEGHWFNDTFLKFDCVERFPFDQHHLASLVADKDRYLFIIAAAFGEDWTNPAAMHKTYVETAKVYEYLGIPDNICVNIHKQGHAVLLSDMEKILDYCDVMLYGKNPEDVETDLQSLKQKEYFLQVK